MARYSLMVAALLGFLITAAAENILLPLLRRLQLHKVANQPVLRRSQPAPPVMGGFAVVLGTMGAVAAAWTGIAVLEPRLVDSYQRKLLMIAMISCTLFALLGIWDDLRTYLRRDHHPLPWLWRILGEGMIAAAFLGSMDMMEALPYGTNVPFFGYLEFGPWVFPLGIVTMIALMEGAALTAQGDGGCSMQGFFACLVCSLVAALQNHMQTALLATALSGALLAFLLWGFPPAKLLLGRTGSSFVAAVIAAVVISTGWGGLLLFLGGLYWVEGGAYLAQGLSYRIRKRPLFKKVPLRLAMEEAGWSERRIVGTVGLTSLMFSMLALLQVLTAVM